MKKFFVSEVMVLAPHWTHAAVSLVAGHLGVIYNHLGTQGTCLRGRLDHNGTWRKESASGVSLAPYWTQGSICLLVSFLVHLCKQQGRKHLVWCTYPVNDLAQASVHVHVTLQKDIPYLSRLLPEENFREPFGLPKIKFGSQSHNFRSLELISD